MATRTRSSDTAGTRAASDVRVLKKYPNRRLYDTHASSYITLADVKLMVLQATPFEVRDAKTGEDLTRSILLQIILEEESGGVPLFTTQMLAQIIRFYGNSMQGLMGSMMEKNLAAFVELQEQLVANSKGMLESRDLTREMWSQAPTMQTLMGTWAEQSRTLFTQMQEQMFAGVAGFGAPKK